MKLQIALPFALVACASPDPRPLDTKTILADLAACTLKTVTKSSQGAAVDLGPGLGLATAIRIALENHPDLRAERAALGLAAAEPVGFAALPDPELGAAWKHVSDYTDSSSTGHVELGLLFSVPRPGELSARETVARAKRAETLARIVHAEQRHVCVVSDAYSELWVAERTLELKQRARVLHEKVHESELAAKREGPGGRLDELLLRLQHHDLERKIELSVREVEVRRERLAELLGLSEAAGLVLAGAEDPLARTALVPSIAELESWLREEAPEVVAMRQEHERVEAEIRLAAGRRWPWPKLGPVYERVGPTFELGLGLGIDLPWFGSAQTELERLVAERARIVESYRALLHGLRSSLLRARADYQALHVRVEADERDLKPLLEEATRLTAEAEKGKAQDLGLLLNVQDRAFELIAELLETRLARTKAVHELARVRAPARSGQR